MTDGADQDHRLPAPLASGYFRVDERDFATLLATMADEAASIPFVNLADVVAGSWRELFLREDACLMALILAEPCALHERRFADLLLRDPPAALSRVLDLACVIDTWLVRLRRPTTRAGADLANRLEGLVTRLAPKLADVTVLADEARIPLAGVRDPARLDPAWRGTTNPPTGDARQRLSAAFHELISGIRYLQGVTPPFFDEALNRDDHEPALALLFTFLRLFGDVQARFNGFTDRHNDFFYGAVLRTRPRPPQPARVPLALPEAKAAAAIAIPKDTPLIASRDGGLERIPFRAEADTFASKARLRRLHTLHYERDPLISPQHELDFVTRVRAARLPARPSGAIEAGSFALLGTAGGEHAALGLCITSPCLLLREGRRRVELRLALGPSALAASAEAATDLRAAFADFLEADPGLVAAVVVTTPADVLDALMGVASGETDAAAAALLPEAPRYGIFLCRLMQVATAERPRGFTAPFGRLVGRLLLGRERTVPRNLVDALVADADRVLGRRPGDETATEHPVRALLTENRAYQYEKYLRDAFTLEFTTADGWHAVEHFGVAPLADGSGRPGLTLTVEFDADAPPFVANPLAARELGRQASAPMMRLRLAAGATLCAQSLLEPFRLDEVAIDVNVIGVRTLAAYGDLGPLDPNQPMPPFGPAPKLGASFVVGAYEAALKPVDRVTLRLEWAGLPRDLGGFATYYRDYGESWKQTPFGAELDWLAGGEWVPVPGGTARLFQPVTASQPLPAAARIDVDVPRGARPLPPTTPETAFAFDVATRSGFARLRLTGPPDAFGHAVYPLLFARTVGRGLAKRRPLRPIEPPYTPTLARLTLDYHAHTVIRVAQVPTEVASARAEFVDHVGPFDVAEIHPDALQPEPGPLPARSADGALYIGLGDLAPGQPVSLLFEMAERAHRRRGFAPPPLAWSYLTARGWQALESSRIVTDTTSGLMRSGVVTVTVPEDADRGGAGMPEGALWLRVAADAGLEAFPQLAGVYVNGLTAVERDGRSEPFPETLEWRFEPPITGLEIVRQIGPPADGLPGETRHQYRARMSERLRHRGRAVTAWDYERLVLERFPQVWKVKCFATLDDERPSATSPGRVLVVVVPRPAAAAAERLWERRMFDVLSLRRIEAALHEFAPAGARVEVRNPTYDLIQVRCRVRFVEAADRGRRLRQLGERIAAYLSPWDDTAGRPGFGWQFNVDEAQAFVAGRAAVAEVSGFAMLMLTADDHGRYRLTDTARAKTEDRRRRLLDPSVPWSLPLPLRRQAPELQVPRHRFAPAPAGVGDLMVGGTFVVEDSEP